jgi:hypothetical protein
MAKALPKQRDMKNLFKSLAKQIGAMSKIFGSFNNKPTNKQVDDLHRNINNLPLSMKPGILIENYELDKNYFNKERIKKVKSVK